VAQGLPLARGYQAITKKGKETKMKIKTSIKAGDGSAAWGG